MSAPASPERPSFFRRPETPSPSPGRAAPAVAAEPPAAPPPRAPLGPPPPRPVAAIRRFTFHGRGSSLFRIHVTNALLTLATLGVYYFWGKTEVRRYLASQTEFEGDRFAYHGTGGELLRGFLKVFGVFGLPVMLLVLALQVAPLDPDLAAVLESIVWLLVSVGSLLLAPVAIVGARRYRLSRLSWRGIRFSFRGKTRDFVNLFVGGSMLTSLTLGLYYPFFDTRRYGFLTAHSYVGNRQFGFDGRGRDLLGPFLLAVLLTLPTLGLCWPWYVARKRRYLWGHTTLEGARFSCGVTGGVLLRLWAGNLLLLVLTLGLARAWVTVRSVRVALEYLALEGPLDPAAIGQDARAGSEVGEGLAGLLDTGGGFDL